MAAEPVPTLASVIFVKVQDFSRRSVAEQTRLRIQLEAVVALAIAGVRAEDRILLDAPDGIAVAVLADPAGALDVAERSLAASAGLPLCIGVNHGPVTVASGGQEGQSLAGDGLHSAALVAGFAEPARVLVSRSFREALAERVPDRDATLRSAGTFTDSSVRTHELLTPDKTLGERRGQKLTAIGVAGVLCLLALGVVLRDVIPRTPAGPPAVVVLRISPGGEVFVDGDSRGKSPPLKRLTLEAGSYTIEIESPPHPPYKVELDLAPGEEVTLRHAFGKKNPIDALKKLFE